MFSENKFILLRILRFLYYKSNECDPMESFLPKRRWISIFY